MKSTGCQNMRPKNRRIYIAAQAKAASEGSEC